MKRDNTVPFSHTEIIVDFVSHTLQEYVFEFASDICLFDNCRLGQLSTDSGIGPLTCAFILWRGCGLWRKWRTESNGNDVLSITRELRKRRSCTRTAISLYSAIFSSAISSYATSVLKEKNCNSVFFSQIEPNICKAPQESSFQYLKKFNMYLPQRKFQRMISTLVK